MELVEAIGLSVADINHVIDTAPARYRVYPIEKRSGGERMIAQPSRELKAIQRFILREKLSSFPVHHCAMAYEEHRSIYANAQMHKNTRAILKLDFQEFFPSLKVADWEMLVSKLKPNAINISDIKLYSKILFWGQQKGSKFPRCLSIGAPTSPKMSNLLMFDFDSIVAEKAIEHGLNYSRYADDITISGDSTLKITTLERDIQKLVRSMKSPRLTFNEEKRGLYTKGQRRMVTGLIITPAKDVSIGRDRKRNISSMLHRDTLRKLDVDSRGQLKGFLGFCAAVEPQFIDRLRHKYGDAAIDRAMKYHTPKRSINET
ncbi:retron St85 family RNA-directed DNA polymerase [Hoeflea sp. IMCC20628]|uniref:retron St85 family RNA-directed DNA polymerase n=1 Tax=Hoeflea sp. IMCC20628 TaxID=1620421 RepID=UPI0018CCD6B2|nr:retron St85 family RNA-directed DNA polymerase [Hoeflea sp. IMCC20628]